MNNSGTSGSPPKPERLFDRETEWGELTRFAGSAARGATLGLLYGRRRQGKTLMLELLARETGGFLFAATQQSAAQNLADLGQAYANHLGLRQPVQLRTWPEALEELLRLGERAATPVLIDEFPYLVAATPALPSYLQRALSPLGFARERTRTRLILCGSALTTMSQLLGSSAPLRGRAELELILRPFGFREAAAFWGTDDLDTAFRLNALVGGTPAYREMCGGSGPGSAREFDQWVLERLLNPASAMFREGRLLLREEPAIADPTSYTAVLAAVSAGNARRSQIAAALERPSTSLAHLLAGLTDVGLLEPVGDALREKRTVWRIAEPVIRLHQLVIARHEPELVAGLADRVWRAVADTVEARIYGPHLEDVARQWCLRHAAPETLGGIAARVLPSEISCRQHQRGHELDVVVIESSPHAADRITAIGEAKATSSAVGIGQLERLEHARALLPDARVSARPKLLLFARSGFTRELSRTAAARADVELIGLGRLYRGA
jgi:hypothetical protein